MSKQALQKQINSFNICSSVVARRGECLTDFVSVHVNQSRLIEQILSNISEPFEDNNDYPRFRSHAQMCTYELCQQAVTMPAGPLNSIRT